MTPSPIAEVAEANSLECVKTSRLAEITERISDVDCVVVVAFGGLVPDDLLDVPRHGWINVHFSLLPAWRGAAPVQHAILAGDDVTGVTTFRIDAGLDTGPVLGHVATSIHPRETAGELLERLSIVGAELMVQTLDGLERGMVSGIPQPLDGISKASKIATADAQIDWTHPALAIDRRVRAMTPEPGPWTTCDGKRVKLAPVSVANDVAELEHLAPGHVTHSGAEVYVSTGSHPVKLSQVQLEGRTMVDAHIWLGNREGVVFE
jgi:methionyl-tRNA formyltransferase